LPEAFVAERPLDLAGWPFAARATRAGVPDFLADLAWTPAGTPPFRLADALVGPDGAFLTFADAENRETATAGFDWDAVDDVVGLTNAQGVAVGKLVLRLAGLPGLRGLGLGGHQWTAAQAELASTCVCPRPSTGVAALAAAGAFWTGEPVLLGGTGVQFEVEFDELDGLLVPVIVVHAAGEALAAQALCDPPTAFAPARLVTGLRVRGPGTAEFTLAPDAHGAIAVVARSPGAEAGALRIRAAGSVLEVSSFGG